MFDKANRRRILTWWSEQRLQSQSLIIVVSMFATLAADLNRTNSAHTFCPTTECHRMLKIAPDSRRGMIELTQQASPNL